MLKIMKMSCLHYRCFWKALRLFHEAFTKIKEIGLYTVLLRSRRRVPICKRTCNECLCCFGLEFHVYEMRPVSVSAALAGK